MMRSTLFYTDKYKEIQERIKEFLNQQSSFLSSRTAQSPRAVGAAVEDILSEHFGSIIGPQMCTKYYSHFGRMDMEDMAFEDKNGFYYAVDVKTHRLMGAKFSMPNLTSVKRLANFYKDDKKYFVMLMIGYEIQTLNVVVKEVNFVPVEFLDWSCLRIGNLGWGQIQIKNSNVIKINLGCSRKKWMIQLCNLLFEFYPKEAEKMMNERIERFRTVKQFWVNHPD